MRHRLEGIQLNGSTTVLIFASLIVNLLATNAETPSYWHINMLAPVIKQWLVGKHRSKDTYPYMHVHTHTHIFDFLSVSAY